MIIIRHRCNEISKLKTTSNLLGVEIDIRSFGKKGFFIRLPNKETGFLSTKKHYTLGEKVIVVAKSFFDEEKLQRFSDKFVYITKFFVFKNGRPSLFLSKKLDKNCINFS